MRYNNNNRAYSYSSIDERGQMAEAGSSGCCGRGGGGTSRNGQEQTHKGESSTTPGHLCRTRFKREC